MQGLGGRRDGVWAQAAVVPRAAVHELPAGLGPREAAAMGIAGLNIAASSSRCFRHLNPGNLLVSRKINHCEPSKV